MKTNYRITPLFVVKSFQKIVDNASLIEHLNALREEVLSVNVSKGNEWLEASNLEILQLRTAVNNMGYKVSDLLENGIDVYPEGKDPHSDTVRVRPESSTHFADQTCTDDVKSVSTPDNTDTTNKNVLILSDSRNLKFNTRLLKSPVSCTVKPLYNILNINQYEEQINNSDVVLISWMVNDIIKWKSTGENVANYLINFLEEAKTKYPHTGFLVSSVAPTTFHSPINDSLLTEFDIINHKMFDYSLSQQHVRLFDNQEFMWEHICDDGVHLTYSGRMSLSRCWVHVILLTLGIKKGPMPLRPGYAAVIKHLDQNLNRS